MALTAYQIAVSNRVSDLAAQVLVLAGTGWVPLGGVVFDSSNNQYAQTMVKGDVAGAPGTGDVYTLPAATTGAIGGVKEAVHQADSVAADIAAMVVDFNLLLGKLQTAGMMA